MNYEKYTVQASDRFRQYEFYSDGPKGRIAKRVTYRRFEDKPNVWNLSFGDVDHEDKINDHIVTDNRDTTKVLATVMQTIPQFFEAYPDQWVFLAGSTPARTRLYRIVIGKNLKEFSKDMEIMGLVEKDWKLFQKSGPYNAFIVRRK